MCKSFQLNKGGKMRNVTPDVNYFGENKSNTCIYIIWEEGLALGFFFNSVNAAIRR
jgi:hypothetical protein